MNDEELIEELITKHLQKGFKHFGIEGTEYVFRQIYANMPLVLERYQKVYDKLIGKKHIE